MICMIGFLSVRLLLRMVTKATKIARRWYEYGRIGEQWEHRCPGNPRWFSLKTQARDASQRASRSSLEVGRSALHVIFPPHLPRDTACPQTESGRDAPRNGWLQAGGIGILGKIRINGWWKFPRETFPHFPKGSFRDHPPKTAIRR